MTSPNQLSFLPDDYLERKAQRRTNVICALLFVIVMSAIAGAFTITDRSIKKVESQHNEVEVQYTEAAKQIDQVQKMQDKQRTMAMQAELTASLLEKVPRSYLLAEITNSMPGGVSLLDFKLTSSKKNVEQARQQTAFEKKKSGKSKPAADAAKPQAQPAVYEVKLDMVGIATTDVQVAQFISKLNQSALLRDVNLLISDEHAQGSEKLRRFQIEAWLSRTAEVHAAAAAEKPKTAAVELKDLIE
jgi:Tfp pilus assembly protein PilN